MNALKVAIMIGTAGSGKTALTESLAFYINRKGEDVCILNLDPGVLSEELPYDPDIDVREFVRAEEIMKKYRLGPNGALIASMDLLLEHIHELRDRIREMDPEILLVDTPGQMEIFAYRLSGQAILREILNFPDTKVGLIYLLDPYLCTISPNTIMSVLLLASSIYWRFLIPTIYALTKIDLFDNRDINRLVEIIKAPSKIMDFMGDFPLGNEAAPWLSVITENEEILSKEIIPISAVTGEGMIDLYSELLNIWSETG